MYFNKMKTAFLGLAFVTAGFATAQSTDSANNATTKTGQNQVQATTQDAEALVKQATEYQNAQNWQAAVETWNKVSALLPDWAPAYYSKGYAYQSAKDNESAKAAYEKYVATVKPEEIEANKQTLGYAYFFLAFSEQQANPEKAKQYITKSLQYDPSNQEAVKLNQILNS